MEQYDVNRDSDRFIPWFLSNVFYGLSGRKKEVNSFLIMGVAIVFTAMALEKFYSGIGMGLFVIGVDFYWFWLRTFLVRKVGMSCASMMTMGGFLIRVISIVAFIRWADSHLSPEAFQKFTGMVLTIPLWNLLEAVFLGKER